MKAVSVNPVAFNRDGTRIVDVVIVADETPAALPDTGETVDGLNADDRFAPMSVLYVVGNADTKVYIANEAGHFVGQ